MIRRARTLLRWTSRPTSTRPAAALAAGLLMGATGLGLVGCSEYEFHPPDREAQVAEAAGAFSIQTYDTVTWASNSIRALEGDVVWSSQCRTCHGPVGRGGTAYARNQGLEVPSLVAPDWRYAGQRDSVLFRIHSGHAGGMPTWSVAGITPREIDAVTYYLLDVLRPEVTGG
jgi:mono/diheme cytochrome c family protein